MRTKFYWDGDVVIHEVRIRLEDNGARLTTWVYDTQNPFTPVAKLTGIGKLSDLQSINQKVYTITSNHLGTPTSMIDETGKKAWEETFDLWGKPHDHLETRVVGGAILTNVKPRESNKNQAISQPFRFPGQYHDEETGLYYNRYRYYMPGEGMYTQRDPIGLAGGNPTVYGYVFNTLQEVDPFGLFRCSNTTPNWTNHGNKHVAPKNIPWKKIVASTKSGPAKYLPNTDIKSLEMNAWKTGTPVTNGKPWVVKKFDHIIGASEGKETVYVRIEISAGTIHGHPISLSEYSKLTRIK